MLDQRGPEGTEPMIYAVCSDGAVFVLWTGDDGRHGWAELPPVPGTERVAVYKVERRCKWMVSGEKIKTPRQCVLETGHAGEHEYEGLAPNGA